MKSRGLIWLAFFCLALVACKKNKNCLVVPAEETQNGQNISQGAIRISCEVEPHYLMIDSLLTCELGLPIDSLFSDDWDAPCDMQMSTVDSSIADVEVRYLQSSLEVTLLNPDLSGESLLSTLNGDSIVSGNYPYYGAYRVIRGSQTIDLFMLNRWIGGCFHDELIWRLSE